MTVEEETGVTCLEAEDTWIAGHQELGEGPGTDSPSSLRWEPTLQPP